MSYQFITCTKVEGIATLTLNRPDVLNSFNQAMAKELQNAFANCETDEAIRVVVLTGAGRAFCAGQDLAEAAPQDQPWPNIEKIVHESYNPIIRAIRQIEKPVIAAINGIAAGAGANIALACDIVLASAKASFVQAFCHIGLIPDSGGTFFLPRLVGLPRATAMMMLGEKISASQALEMGMIYQVHAPEALQTEIQHLATHLASRPTRGLGLTKRALNASFTNTLDAQLVIEADLQKAASETQDFKEGVNAFLEKRKPKFNGR